MDHKLWPSKWNTVELSKSPCRNPSLGWPRNKLYVIFVLMQCFLTLVQDGYDSYHMSHRLWQKILRLAIIPQKIYLSWNFPKQTWSVSLRSHSIENSLGVDMVGISNSPSSLIFADLKSNIEVFWWLHLFYGIELL